MCDVCKIYKDNKNMIVMEGEMCFVIRDSNPVNHGHLLVIPKRHVETFFDMSYEEYKDMNMLLKNCKSLLDSTIEPDGYNIGFNIGYWGGQTINHCYAELIPRFAGDVPITNLSGGIRNFKKSLEDDVN